jgi:hypothetical protein
VSHYTYPETQHLSPNIWSRACEDTLIGLCCRSWWILLVFHPHQDLSLNRACWWLWKFLHWGFLVEPYQFLITLNFTVYQFTAINDISCTELIDLIESRLLKRDIFRITHREAVREAIMHEQCQKAPTSPSEALHYSFLKDEEYLRNWEGKSLLVVISIGLYVQEIMLI